jgi:hypothetical protein
MTFQLGDKVITHWRGRDYPATVVWSDKFMTRVQFTPATGVTKYHTLSHDCFKAVELSA